MNTTQTQRKPRRRRRNNKNANFTDLSAQTSLVNAPVAANRSSRRNTSRTLRFTECERITTISGSTAFSVGTSISCNPGLSASFPWLSGHAQLFEKYKVHKLIFRYKNLKGTSSAGNILMSFDYDSLDAAPTTAIAMTQSTKYIDGAPWRIFELNVPSDNRTLFTRPGPVPGADLKTYDMGVLYVAAEGCADTTDHGYLEVEYDIELMQKQPTTTSIIAGAVLSSACYGISATTTASETVTFDLLQTTDTLGGSMSSGVYTIPIDGTYLIEVSMFNVSGGIELFLNGSAFTNAIKTQNSNISSLAQLTANDTISVFKNGGSATDHPGSLITFIRIL
jgi:hypothetical protein